MRAPRYEGSNALWHPILLGHELAHIAVSHYDALRQLDIARTFDFVLAETLDVPGTAQPGPAGALRLFEIAENWAVELLCDAFAVRAFGRAALPALAEYLETVGAIDLLSQTHPPGRLRVKLVKDWITTSSERRIQQVVEPWAQLAAEAVSYSEPWAGFLVQLLTALEDDIKATAETWPYPMYEDLPREAVVLTLADLFQEGIVGDVTALAEGSRIQVEAPDVITAAWVARVECHDTPTDKLARKTLDNINFMTRWAESGGAWPAHWAPSAALSGEAATLSAQNIQQRIDDQGPDGLVVSPLLPDFAGGASLDLRLGNSFIVFVRSRTASLDPLDEEQDPRQVQRHIQLAWGDTFVLHPLELVVAASLEYLVLPADLTGQVLSRSSYGRLGLLSATAVQVHPRFHGCLTLELVNLGTVPLVLTPGERIAQLVLSPVARVPAPAVAKYHCAIGPEFSKVRHDDEAEVLRHLR